MENFQFSREIGNHFSSSSNFHPVFSRGLGNRSFSKQMSESFKLQRRAVKIIASVHWSESRKPLFRKLSFLTLTTTYFLEIYKFLCRPISMYAINRQIINAALWVIRNSELPRPFLFKIGLFTTTQNLFAKRSELYLHSVKDLYKGWRKQF